MSKQTDPAETQTRLKITEIFYSLQGEARNVGLPTVFIRLTGCPLRCGYCDTAYAFSGGEWMQIDDIITQVRQYDTSFVTVTGGEPLAQKSCIELLSQLCDAGYDVSLETSGAILVDKVDPRVVKILDVKTPASTEDDKNKFENLAYLQKYDQVKFVICDENDYLWSRQIIEQYQLVDRCEVLFSPSHGQLEASVLADWILRDQLNVRFQIQLHKYLWGDKPGV
ncbi:MAG: 7-carboxy-7-deazaguanine synthase QueE [Gammaproteobacteria bacterium]|nr:7-carboxy-7-deazaguanine synthase QueE [Gammaproteobacteria bacterium]MBT8133038.1 7-carboxy-7-deazaguanine synthase QueE [Gammaproteobacteria bacterium]NNJ50875.1 7-carboxy-7-deazaguanine synthase QueE [Gammaproteobacteria bacterium]